VIGRHLVLVICVSARAGGSQGGQGRAPGSQPGRRTVPTSHLAAMPGTPRSIPSCVVRSG